jgi:DNA-binding CsgD family transcriptional regulator
MPAPQSSGDTVTLTQSAQVSQLRAQGESASSIAQNLGVSVSVVNLDLGIVAQAASIH